MAESTGRTTDRSLKDCRPNWRDDFFADKLLQHLRGANQGSSQMCLVGRGEFTCQGDGLCMAAAHYVHQEVPEATEEWRLDAFGRLCSSGY
jgi:hypothetical protein